MPLPIVPPDPMPPLVGDGSNPSVALAGAAVRDYCGWHIAPEIQQVETVSARGGRVLMLETLHLTGVVSATSDAVDVGVVTEWDDFGIVVYPGDSCRWSSKLRGTVVTFTHGYPECPAALAGVIASMAARGVTSLGVTREQVGQVSHQYAPGGADGALGGTDAEMKIISRYRIPQST